VALASVQAAVIHGVNRKRGLVAVMCDINGFGVVWGKALPKDAG